MPGRKFKSREEYEREREVSLLAAAIATANPRYVIEAAGMWLQRWRRERSVDLGRPKPRRCGNTAPAQSL